MSLTRPPYFGAAYYPEDWPAGQIDADIALMKQAGMNVMRVAEFAWSRMEPREGQYDFAWLHQVVDKLAEAGIATIMCTPTCTPPAWLVERYPETLIVNERGVRAQHGARRHMCPNSPTYREHCTRIVTRMAQQFGQNPNVIGWQIDNELSWMTKVSAQGCCCSVCHAKFREAMRQRFGTIEALNEAWCTNLWSQTYHSFGQLPVPRGDTWHHPSLLTAWMEFQSDSYVDFCDHQADLLHRLADQPVSTDIMPTLAVDHEKLHRKLDLVQFNHYNSMDDLFVAAMWMDACRPLKPAPFWNTETSTCWNGSNTARGYREPGFCRANSWLPIAQGGEANLYWLWRAHWTGQELMHGSVIDSAGRPLHIFEEVRQIAQGLRRAEGFLNGTRPVQTGLAIHLSGFAWRMFPQQPIVNQFNYHWQMAGNVYRPVIRAQFRPDVISPAAALEPYRLVLSPFVVALDESGLRQRIEAWVQAGGTWLVGPMSDIRDLNAAKFRHAPFGSLEEWAGVYGKYGIPGDPRDFALQWDDGSTGVGSVWYDSFELRGAEALATYTEGPMAGLAAVTRKRVGKGQIVVLGTLPRHDGYAHLVARLASEANVQPAAQASPNLLVVPRQGSAGHGMIVVELEHKPAQLRLPAPAVDLLTGREHAGSVEVEPFGVMVLQYAQ